MILYMHTLVSRAGTVAVRIFVEELGNVYEGKMINISQQAGFMYMDV